MPSNHEVEETMQLRQVCNAFWALCEIEKNLTDHTLRAYRGDLEDFTNFAGAESALNECDKIKLRAYLVHLSERRCLMQTSIKRRVACLKSMYSWIGEEE
jgi:integrase/recombinase XerD